MPWCGGGGGGGVGGGSKKGGGGRKGGGEGGGCLLGRLEVLPAALPLGDTRDSSSASLSLPKGSCLQSQ